MKTGFFAAIGRMRYISRWALMRNTHEENLSVHSMDVAVISHALCVIGNVRYGKQLDAERAAMIGLYHDASEIVTGDMPTPVKYWNSRLRDAYRDVERAAEEQLLEKLPEDLRPVYESIFWEDRGEEDTYMRSLVKAADTISALIKCVEEARSGNQEFVRAEEAARRKIQKMQADMPEVDDFMRDFFPAYGRTLDELTER